jgi:hypothetical protein
MRCTKCDQTDREDSVSQGLDVIPKQNGRQIVHVLVPEAYLYEVK